MSDLTPAKIMATFKEVSRRIDEETSKLRRLDIAEIHARHAYRRTYNMTLMTAQGAADIRRAAAEQAASDLEMAYDLAGAELRAVKDELKMLRDRLEIGRSTSAVMRMEWSNGHD